MTKSKVNYKSVIPSDPALAGKSKESRKGIAIIIAMIFMAALLTIATTVAEQATNMDKVNQGSEKSDQALYNAETAAEEALFYYKHPDEMKPGTNLTGGKNYDNSDNQSEQSGNYRILSISGDSKLTPVFVEEDFNKWNMYPFPGTGTAGKDCDIYHPIKIEEEVKNKIGEAVFNQYDDLQKPEDYPCNWNKISSTDSAVEIPLYATAPDGTKVWLKFDEIKIRVRTACRENDIRKDKDKTDENKNLYNLYEKTGMCRGGHRYVMFADYYPDILGGVKSGKQILENTPLNWGIYSEEGGFNYLIPIKKEGTKEGDIKDTLNSNIHTYKINKSKDFGSGMFNDEYFVVLDGNTAGFSASPNLKDPDKKIVKFINKESSEKGKPEILNPILRLTVDYPFKGGTWIMDTNQIPYLEYQILYKINENETKNEFGESIINPQIVGTPIFIGEGRSGQFMHTVRLYIYETKTGFDYLYQKQ